MKIGVFVLQSEDSTDPAVLAKRAEELGFESYWVPEHPIVPVITTLDDHRAPGGRIPEVVGRLVDPFVALARASAVTQSIKLGTSICLVPQRNPIHLAKEVATLDHYSGGRVILGVGAGWIKEEGEIMGVDFDHRWAQTRDAVLAMKELWTKDESEYHGRYYDFSSVRSFPKPAQKPHPPLLVGGHAKSVFRRVVEWGDGWIPSNVTKEEVIRGCATLNEVARQAGRDPSSLQVTLFASDGQFRNRTEIEELEEAGVGRVNITLLQTGGEGAMQDIEEIARQVLPQ